MSLQPICVLASTFLIAIGLAPELNAQTTISGALTGVVTDQSHAVVANAAVELKDDAKGITQPTKTDREGVYRLFFLAPARYRLTVTHEGFREQSRAVNVVLGPPVTVNVTLELAKASATVTVTTEAPLIQAENGDVSATMNQKQISEVPNPGNDLTYIVQTAPGAVMDTDLQIGTNFSILGMPGTSYLYTLDGSNNNDNIYSTNLSGALGLLLGQNQIQEATVVTTGYSGQFGGAAGGNINYITKSGTNELHGNAQYYWNGRVFNANNWFNNAFGLPRPFSIANQWAGSVGGPLQKDKLFFFLDTEGLRLLLPQPNAVQIPSPQFEDVTLANIDLRFGRASASDVFYKRIFSLYNAAPGASSATPGGLVPTDRLGCGPFVGPKDLGTSVPCALHFFSTVGRPSHDSLTSSRVDWNVRGSDRTFLRLQYDGGRSALAIDPISSAFDTDFHQSWWQGQVVETHTFGSSGASQFLLAGSYLVPISQVKNPAQALSTFPTVLNFFVPGTFANLGGADNLILFGYGRHRTHYQLAEDVVRSRRNHKLGFGAQFTRIHWSELPNKSGATGALIPQTLDAFFQGGVDSASPSDEFHATLPVVHVPDIAAALVCQFWTLRPGRVACAP